jgi:hypothetical protein
MLSVKKHICEFKNHIEYGNVKWSAFFGNNLETIWKRQKMPYKYTLYMQQNILYLTKIYINSFTILFIYTNGNTILYYYCNKTTQGSR